MEPCLLPPLRQSLVTTGQKRKGARTRDNRKPWPLGPFTCTVVQWLSRNERGHNICVQPHVFIPLDTPGRILYKHKSEKVTDIEAEELKCDPLFSVFVYNVEILGVGL